MYKKINITILFFLALAGSYADGFHNINGFFGERATGMGGAFTAISDDPSGTYYNPAGLSFSYDDSISMSIFSYNSVQKTYQDIWGPGQNLVENLNNFSPNFIGSIKSFGKYKFGLSLVNKISQSSRRYEQLNLSLYFPDVKDAIRQETSETNQILLGPSLSMLLTPKLSIGGSLYMFRDIEYLASSSLFRTSDTGLVQTSRDDRTTNGIYPIFGLLYAIRPKVSLGFSVSRTMPSSRGKRYQNSFIVSTSNTSQDGVAVMQGSQSGSGGKINDSLGFSGPVFSAETPKINEYRIGIAWFPNSKFLMAFDTVYTDGYRRSQDQTRYFYSGSSIKHVILTENENSELYRSPTLNLAFGLEYFPKETLSLRGGVFTNRANTKKIKWADTLLINSISNFGEDSILNLANTSNQQVSILYVPQIGELFGEKSRGEYINTIGYCLGISWNLPSASFNLSVVYEHGKGNSKIENSNPLQTVIYEAVSMYLAVSSKQ
ncbi:MAG: hypothetical protein H7A23_20020 [Leptospiraceae bacterium]|nr:hypothetical protein [Leptospiraceae bacterium]MCP5496845.1 hypothetical protein [Leptospiraceae bacterium]